ncbi:ATP-binding protein [Sneathiella marina]|uniref:histidine kinase n=1 Tax=Sneathiella marina TaxID=2950108 RepID=A0ABY4W5F3_9PROT|nr:ATP-binding protein [Sneathiella marina]USG62054.1 ATP-binding protein [Sneathiella marina]
MRLSQKALFLTLLILAAIVGAVVSFYYYQYGKSSYVERKTEEKGTVLQLITAFVSTYGEHRIQNENYPMPVPAEFRAVALNSFNNARQRQDTVQVEMIGIPGLEIANSAKDDHSKKIVQQMAVENSLPIWSGFLRSDGPKIFRTIKPVFADKNSCVTCHNSIQKGTKTWKLGDLIGAYVLDVSAANFFADLRRESLILGIISFLLTTTFGVVLLSFQARIAKAREQVEREIERQKYEERARHAAEAAERAKSAFLANMSHELRTPLNAVIGFSEIFMDEILGKLGNPKYREYAADINEAGKHLLALINDILDLSKVESGSEKLEEDKIEVVEIIRSAVKLVEHRAGQDVVKIKLKLQDPLLALWADERRLKQILVNILSNAIKFTDAGGEVTLSVSCQGNRGYVFQITDTGIGIQSKDIPTVLSRFGQVNGEKNRKNQGTGLGLSLTKALVEQHGGVLDLQSEVNIGTTVTVQFPAERTVSQGWSINRSDEFDTLPSFVQQAR